MKKSKLVATLALSTVALSIAANTVQADEANSYESNGAVQFIPNEGKTDPVDPINPDPDQPVNPVDPTKPDGPDDGTNGPLSIDYASSFDFGVNRISNKDENYFARAQKYTNNADTPNFIQVSDNRGTNAGWILKVKQVAQFESATETLNHTLTGAKISLSSPKVSSNAENVASPVAKDNLSLIPGAETIVTSAEKNAGAGTWSTYWGSVEQVDEVNQAGETNKVNVTKDINLSVPGSTPKDAVKYQTKLVWTITEAPQN